MMYRWGVGMGGILLWLLMVLFVAAVVVGIVFRPNVRLTRRLPPPACAGEVMSYPVTVENRGRLIARGPPGPVPGGAPAPSRQNYAHTPPASHPGPSVAPSASP